jgi:hypothetical protein
MSGSHNIALLRHRYVHIRDGYAGPDAHHAVWFGVSVTPGRALGCHVLLEVGAVVVDLPLHALAATPDAPPIALPDAVQWDSYGWRAEIFEPPYLCGLTCDLLTADHQSLTGQQGSLWFALDHIGDGYSLEPGQHKHLWVIAREDGCFLLLPQDRFLVHEASFTAHDGIPRIHRQTAVWSAEP